MNEYVAKYLTDVLDCIDFIEDVVGETKNFYNYQNSKLVKPAIERKVEIIGEAINKANKLYPELPLSNKLRIIGMRNRIIHSYDAVDDAMVWEVVVKHIPLLKEEIKALLNNV